MALPRIIFRADGNERIGLGHIHRSLALAKILRLQFDITFALYQPLPGIKSLLGQFSIIDVPDVENEIDFLIGQSSNYEILVLDGYKYDAHFQREMKKASWKIVCVDDLCAFHFYADAVINHAGGVSREMYTAEPYTQFYLGPSYAIVKELFLIAAKNRKNKGNKNAVLVCMGGADTHENHTLQILKSVKDQSDELHYYVVVGEAYPFYDTLAAFARASTSNITILKNLPADEMLHYMCECGIAICPPSGVAYEYLHVGGELYLRQTVPNQERLMQFLISSGLAFDFHHFRIKDHQKINNAKANQAKEFDGNSDIRIKKIFESMCQSLHYHLRPADPDDVHVFFHWINNAEVRRNSIHMEPVEWAHHVAWYNTKLKQTDSYIFILVNNANATPVGQIRFDYTEKYYLIDYSIDAQYRGAGLGSEIIRLGINSLLKKNLSVRTLKAEVLETNFPSIKIFENLYFKRMGIAEREGRKFIQFEKCV